MLATTALGTVLAWLFIEDRTRNLSALAFIHGFFGSTFGRLFGKDSAGHLRVDYRVGPWNMEEPPPPPHRPAPLPRRLHRADPVMLAPPRG